jgi:hypothetical protein
MCPSWVFGLLGPPVRPQAIPILASHALVEQLVASGTRTIRSVSIGIYSLRPGSWVFICLLGGIALIVTVLEKWDQSPEVRVQRGGPLRGSRAVERPTCLENRGSASRSRRTRGLTYRRGKRLPPGRSCWPQRARLPRATSCQRTFPPMTPLKVALCGSCGAVVRTPRRRSYTHDLEML